MKIRFLQKWRVAQGDGKGPVYEAGQEVDFVGKVAETYARKYVARGLAVQVTADDAARRLRPPMSEAPPALTAEGLLAAIADSNSDLSKNFNAFRVKAAEILGDDTPAKKADIVAALQARVVADAGGGQQTQSDPA